MSRTSQMDSMIETLDEYGDFAHGGDPEGAARDWIEHGFEARQVAEWLEARVFTASAARRLADAGLSPGDVDIEYAAMGQRDTLGYWVANGDASIDEAVAATKAAPEVLGLGGDDWTDDEDRAWMRYGTVCVRLGSVDYEVGVAIGVPEYQRGTAEAAGGDTITPYLSAWYVDAGDWANASASVGRSGLPASRASDVLGAISNAARELWREHATEGAEA